MINQSSIVLSGKIGEGVDKVSNIPIPDIPKPEELLNSTIIGEASNCFVTDTVY